MVCTSCQTNLPKESHFCSKCGASQLDGAATTVAELDRRSDGLLAEANLLRMRGQWQQAETCCIDVMRVNPNNVHAHSLLGDIFRDQGRYDESHQWYQMALDLNPSSSADRAKLVHVEQVIARERFRQSGDPANSGPGLNLGTQKLMGLPPSTWIRGLTAASVLFLVCALAFLLMPRTKPAQSQAVVGTIPGVSTSSSTSNRPLTETADPLPTSLPGNTLGSLTSSDNASSASAQTPSGRNPALGSTSSPRGGFTHQEQVLQSILSRPGGFGPETSIVSATVDPREPRINIALAHTPRAATPQAARMEIARIAFHAARIAFAAETNVNHVSVNVRASIGQNGFEPAFMGDLDRPALQSLSSSATADQVVALFTNAWWSPLLSPRIPADELSGPGAGQSDGGT